jgi:phage terminase large subunit
MAKVKSKVLEVNPTFEPIFRDDLKQKRYYQVYGGRGSGKSFIASIAIVQLTYSKFNHNVMYLRQTMTTIEDSSYKDVMDAIEFLEKQSDFKTIKNRIVNKKTGSIISFKGIRSTSGAKLKSLAGFTTLVVEEAEEIESFEEFSKIDEGIRVKGKPLKIVLLYNPGSAIASWIHKEWFIEGQPDPDRFSDSIFMHSTFLDNEKNLNPQVVQRYKDLAHKRPTYYTQTILAEWTLEVEGRIYDGWDVWSKMDEIGEVWYGMDFGYGGGDHTALIEINKVGDRFYCREVFSFPQQRIRDTIAAMHKAGIPRHALIYADHSMPLLIHEIRAAGFSGITKCKKGSVEAGLKKIQNKDITIIDEDNSSQLYFGYMTFKRDKNGKLPHEPDSLAAMRYGINSKKVEYTGSRSTTLKRRKRSVGFL